MVIGMSLIIDTLRVCARSTKLTFVFSVRDPTGSQQQSISARPIRVGTFVCSTHQANGCHAGKSSSAGPKSAHCDHPWFTIRAPARMRSPTSSRRPGSSDPACPMTSQRLKHSLASAHRSSTSTNLMHQSQPHPKRSTATGTESNSFAPICQSVRGPLSWRRTRTAASYPIGSGRCDSTQGWLPTEPTSI